MENFCGALSTVLAITPENEGLLRSGYVVRQEGELAVLSRWFPATAVGAPPVAKWLDVILYSREQIRKENEVCQRVYLQTSVSSLLGCASLLFVGISHSNTAQHE